MEKQFKFSLIIILFTSFLLFYESLKNFNAYKTLLLFFFGIFLWTICEYIGHRVLHYLIHKGHKYHHDNAKYKNKYSIGPLISGTLIDGGGDIVVVLYFIIYPMLMKTILSGFLLGWALYDILHYTIHTYSPPFKFLIPLWRNHVFHHFNENKNFGVSSPLWDKIFNTFTAKVRQRRL